MGYVHIGFVAQHFNPAGVVTVQGAKIAGLPLQIPGAPWGLKDDFGNSGGGATTGLKVLIQK